MPPTIRLNSLFAKTEFLGQIQVGHMVNNLLKTLPIDDNQFGIDTEKFLMQTRFAKTVNQEHSTVMRQVAAVEENFDISGSFGHNTQTVHFGRFLCEEFYKPCYTPFSSKNTNIKLQNNWFLRIFEDYLSEKMFCFLIYV